MSESDGFIRVAVFLVVILLLLACERLLPARSGGTGKRQRWIANGVLFLLGIFATRLLGPLVAVNAAIWSSERGTGLLNAFDISPAFELIMALLLLDAAIYLQHWASHRLPLLWRLHRVHHADNAIDVSTALRFHPFEIALSMLYKCFVVIAIGASWWAVLLFEVILNASAMFNHSNIRLPARLDRNLRVLLITPSAHLIHHSTRHSQQHSNFGFCLSVWDRLFTTYRSPDREVIVSSGLQGVGGERAQSLRWMILSPFTGAQSQAGDESR